VWTAPHRENDNVSVSYFIRYVGVPKDVAAFLEHYRLRHSRIMREYPGIRGCRLHHPIEWDDPVKVNKDNVFMLAELIFDTREDLDRALQSDVRQRSRADFLNFPPLENGEIRHLAVQTETLF
jgi:uncharacterized protein (TIGR02118 family)